MALAFGLQKAGYTPTELSTEAVTLISEGQGFRISRSALSLRASVPNIDETTFTRLASDAEKTCPVSRVLNAEITLDGKLTRECGLHIRCQAPPGNTAKTSADHLDPAISGYVNSTVHSMLQPNCEPACE